MVRTPPPPPPGIRPAKLTTEEEKVAPVNVGFTAFLSGVNAKNSPQRFEEPVRDRPPEKGDRVFTEAHLEAFFGSLDGVLMPAALASDAGMRRVWTRFWASRTRCFGWFLWRFAEETEKRSSRRLDPQRDREELQALERSLVRVMIARDRRHLRSFVGRRGVDLIDLTFALWVSHADQWFELATAPSPIAAARQISGSAQDAIERTRSNVDFGGGDRHANTPRAAAQGVRPYQALTSKPGKH